MGMFAKNNTIKTIKEDMLNSEELLRLEELKEELVNRLDVIDYSFSDEEIKAIFEEIDKFPEEERSIALWQKIVKEQTGVKRFKLFESLDLSDINYLHKQIQNLLNKK